MRNDTIRSIVRAYDDPVVRAYCWARFLVLRQRFLEEIGQYLPPSGPVLDIRCGFGLFSPYSPATGGLLLVKDVDTRPAPKRWFTWALDRLMAPRTPVHYWSTEELTGALERAGFGVRRHLMVDLLPYPHVLYICEARR